MRIMGLDTGEKRIGVALSDPLGIIAFAHAIIQHKDQEADINAILSVAREQGVELIIVGIPYSLSGSLGPQGQITMDFYQLLRERSPLPVLTWDERFTTSEALYRLREAGIKPSKQKARVDAAAAAIILQSYLDSQKQQSG